MGIITSLYLSILRCVDFAKYVIFQIAPPGIKGAFRSMDHENFFSDFEIMFGYINLDIQIWTPCTKSQKINFVWEKILLKESYPAWWVYMYRIFFSFWRNLKKKWGWPENRIFRAISKTCAKILVFGSKHPLFLRFLQ